MRMFLKNEDTQIIPFNSETSAYKDLCSFRSEMFNKFSNCLRQLLKRVYSIHGTFQKKITIPNPQH